MFGEYFVLFDGPIGAPNFHRPKVRQLVLLDWRGVVGCGRLLADGTWKAFDGTFYCRLRLQDFVTIATHQPRLSQHQPIPKQTLLVPPTLL